MLHSHCSLQSAVLSSNKFESLLLLLKWGNEQDKLGKQKTQHEIKS